MSYQCCNAPDHIRAYIWRWPFTAWYCNSCGEVGEQWGWFRSFVFNTFFWPFWDGRMLIPEDQLTDSARIREDAQ
jgi:hypothetical protein